MQTVVKNMIPVDLVFEVAIHPRFLNGVDVYPFRFHISMEKSMLDLRVVMRKLRTFCDRKTRSTCFGSGGGPVTLWREGKEGINIGVYIECVVQVWVLSSYLYTHEYGKVFVH